MATKKVVAKRNSYYLFRKFRPSKLTSKGRQTSLRYSHKKSRKQAAFYLFLIFRPSQRRIRAQASFPTKFSVQDEKFLFPEKLCVQQWQFSAARQSKIGCQLPTADFNTKYSVAPAYSACSSTAGCNFSFILLSSSAITSGFSSSQRLAFSLPCPTRSPL